MDERYTGNNSRRRTGSSMNPKSEQDFVFDWKNPDIGTTPTRSAGSSYKSTRPAYRPSTPAHPTGRRPVKPQTMNERDILMFGDEEQESGTFDGRKNHTSQRSGSYGRKAAKKSNPVGDILGGIGSAVAGVVSAIAGAVSGLLSKKESTPRSGSRTSGQEASANAQGSNASRRRKKKKNRH